MINKTPLKKLAVVGMVLLVIAFIYHFWQLFLKTNIDQNIYSSTGPLTY